MFLPINANCPVASSTVPFSHLKESQTPNLRTHCPEVTGLFPIPLQELSYHRGSIGLKEFVDSTIKAFGVWQGMKVKNISIKSARFTPKTQTALHSGRAVVAMLRFEHKGKLGELGLELSL